MRYLAYTRRESGEEFPKQEHEEAVVATILERRLPVPMVRPGWFHGNHTGGQISSEQFAGAFPIWYWEVK